MLKPWASWSSVSVIAQKPVTGGGKLTWSQWTNTSQKPAAPPSPISSDEGHVTFGSMRLRPTIRKNVEIEKPISGSASGYASSAAMQSQMRVQRVGGGTSANAASDFTPRAMAPKKIAAEHTTMSADATNGKKPAPGSESRP